MSLLGGGTGIVRRGVSKRFGIGGTSPLDVIRGFVNCSGTTVGNGDVKVGSETGN